MNIDQYIKKATVGLPTRERIDTSAELRVHLNAQVKKHLLEGHNQEEAEFLAVDAMGAVAPVNRQFLGHIFTPRIGWGLVIATLVATSGWLGINKLLEPKAGIYQSASNIGDIQLAMSQQFYNFDVNFPPEAQSLRIYEHRLDFKNSWVQSQPIPKDKKLRLSIRMDGKYQCEPKMIAAVAISMRSSEFSSPGNSFCVLPKKNERTSYGHGVFSNNQFNVDTWYPVFHVKHGYYSDMGDNREIEKTKNMFVYYVMLSSKNIAFEVNAPILPEFPRPFSDIDENQNTRFGSSELSIPKNTKSVLVVGSAQKLRYTGFVVDLTTRENQKKFKIEYRKDGIRPNITGNCQSETWGIRFSMNPSERSFNLCETLPEKGSKDFPRDNKNYGEFFSVLPLKDNLPLDQWIPVFNIPSYQNSIDSTPDKDSKFWYIVQVKFSSQRISEGTIVLPKNLPTYKQRFLNDYMNLEAIK